VQDGYFGLCAVIYIGISLICPIHAGAMVIIQHWRKKMGTIRDEILALSEQWKEESWSHIYNQALVDAAHILDEWRLVAEYQFTSQELAELDIFDGPCPPNKAKTIEFNPGDHIAIYVRRGKKDEHNEM